MENSVTIPIIAKIRMPVIMFLLTFIPFFIPASDLSAGYSFLSCAITIRMASGASSVVSVTTKTTAA